MPDKERSESLEVRWDILYRDYPAVYEEWGRIPKGTHRDNDPLEVPCPLQDGCGEKQRSIQPMNVLSGCYNTLS